MSRPLKRPGPIELTDAYENKLKKLIGSVESAIEECDRALSELPGYTPEERRGVLKYLTEGQIVWSDAKDGRRKDWEYAKLFYLWLDVHEIMEREKCGERKACQTLLESRAGQKWYSRDARYGRKVAVETLRDLFNNAKKLRAVEHLLALKERGEPAPGIVERVERLGDKVSRQARPMLESALRATKYDRIVANLRKPETRAELLKSADPERLLQKLLRPGLCKAPPG